MGDVLDHARRFVGLGFAVLPLHRPMARDGRRICSCGRASCHSPAKHPAGGLVPRGVHDATRDLATIERWFGNGDGNLGIATGAASGVIVLDVDPRNGGDTTLAGLETLHGPLPPTWRVLTGGGGEHVFFRHPGRAVPNTAGALGHGLDLKADGGYVVAPPSEHISGRRYAFSVDHHPDEVALADPPAWLLPPSKSARLVRGAGVKPVLAIGSDPIDWRARHRGVPEGQRNAAIAREAGMLLAKGVEPHACLGLMLAFNAARCLPPLAETEVVATVASIARRELRRRPSAGGRARG